MRYVGPALSVITAALAAAGCHLLLAKPIPLSNVHAALGPVRFEFADKTFRKFVDRSFELEHAGDSDQFYKTFDNELVKARGYDWNGLLAKHDKSYGNPEKERALGEDLWKGIKQTIRKFSLDRGFEFANVVKTGERQCFLQAVIISGLAQKGGLNSGVVMVWKNPQGQTSNLGHATAIVRLSDDRDLIIDASDPVPTVKHQGLFLYSVPDHDFRFLTPVYNPDETISGYRTPDGRTLRPNQTHFLDHRFLESQFDYYRGERAVGGLLAKDATRAGLDLSVARLRDSVKESSANPLATYMLGTALAKTGNTQEANQWFDKAKKLYQRYGWTPETVDRARA